MGVLSKISGPVIQAEEMRGSQINELVKVGDMELMGEIIALKNDRASIQVYEETSGLRPGEKVTGTGSALSVELGPGLLGGVFDGIQRPLNKIKEKSGDFIARGISVPSLDRKKEWDFHPAAKKGDTVEAGDVLGEVKEYDITHRILVPLGVKGKVTEIKKGKFTVVDDIAVIDGKKVQMMQRWPVRSPRQYKDKKHFEPPLVTGKRIIDSFFPIAKGGTAAIPGPFGSGKCVGGSTPVLLQDGSVKTMRDLYEYATRNGESHKTVFEETITLNNPLKLYSMMNGEIRPTETRQFYKGKSDSLLRIITRTGKMLEVTPIHKLFAVEGDGTIVEKEARMLSSGAFIASARLIKPANDDAIDLSQFGGLRVANQDVRTEISKMLKGQMKRQTLAALACDIGLTASLVKRLVRREVLPTWDTAKRIYAYFAAPLPPIEEFVGDRTSKKTRLPKEVTPELAEFLGLFVAEGYIRGPCTVVFTNTDEILLNRFAALARTIFGLETKIERQTGKAANALVSSTVLATFLRAQCGEKAKGKRIPAPILRASHGCIAAFLEAYYEGDGTFHKHTVEFCTASNQLQVGLSYLLNRLGVLHKLSARTIYATQYYRIFVSGANASRLAECFAGASPKTQKLAAYANSQSRHYDSVDIVPLSQATMKTVYENAGKPYAQLQKAGVRIDNYLQGEHITAGIFKKMCAVLSQVTAGSQCQTMTGQLTQLAGLLDWIYCDEITSIEEIRGPHDVYDFILPGIENFVGGWGGTILHNTVTQTDLAKFSDADVIIYIGCGERGNELTEVLQEFPKLKDPHTGLPLMNRTVMIANTSNMPVAAREASIYTGITIAEYYRDMGYDVALMADSTSRWAEAMREISGRMEEMPGEEGYPAYLGKKLAEFYERSGRVNCLGSDKKDGSISVIGAVSPPGGDLSEPVSQATLRVTKVFWALDANLARRRHYPAINWLRSYSLYLTELKEWYGANVAEDFLDLRGRAMVLLQKEAELQNIVQLIGPDALPDKERLVLEATKMIREDFLQQNSFDDADAFTPPKKQYEMLKTIMHFYYKAGDALSLDVPLSKILEAKEIDEIAKMKRVPPEEMAKKAKAIREGIDRHMAK